MRRSCIALVLLASSACGPATGDDAELREVCGEAAPVRMLALPEDAAPFGWSEPEVIDADRLLWAVQSFVPDGVFFPYRNGPRSVWITGSCGESPRRIDGIEDAWIDARLPGVIVAPIGDQYPRDVVVIDPDAPERRTVLFAGVGVRLGDSPHGWLSIDDVEAELATLAFRPYPDDPWSGPVAPVELANVRGPFTSPEVVAGMRRVDVRDDAVWVLSADDELTRIAMPSGTSTLEQTGVLAFELSEDARWLIWQDDVIVDDRVPSYPTGQVSLRDRDDGSERRLWIAALGPPALVGVEHGGLRGPDGWVRLSDLAPAPIPEWTNPTAGDRWILRLRTDSADVDAEPIGLSLIDFETGAQRVLYDRPADVVHWRDDGLEVAHRLRIGEYPPSPNEAELTFVPFDGPPRKLAHAATTMYLRLHDGRVVTPLDVDPERRGALALVEPETLEDSRIDDDVFVVQGLREADPELWGEAVVLYSVADGERSGMWIAGLPVVR